MQFPKINKQGILLEFCRSCDAVRNYPAPFYVKNGTDWREAELLARQDIDILKLNVSRVTENILWGD